MPDRERDDAEGNRLYRSLGRIARAAPVVLPGVIQGAQQGSVVGPWGAVAGGLVGGASRLGGPRAEPGRARIGPPPPSSRPAPRIEGPVPGVAPGPPVGTAPASPAASLGVGNANPAAAELLGLLQDPCLAQACAALTAGARGPREIAVAGASAPPAAFLNLLCWLAQEAAQQAPAGEAPVDGYLRGADGSYATDVASPAARARVLLDRIQAERAGGGARAVAASATAEQWLLESGLAELVAP